MVPLTERAVGSLLHRGVLGGVEAGGLGLLVGFAMGTISRAPLAVVPTRSGLFGPLYTGARLTARSLNLLFGLLWSVVGPSDKKL